MKRLLSMLMAGILCVGMLATMTGCGTKKDDTAADAPAVSMKSASSSAASPCFHALPALRAFFMPAHSFKRLDPPAPAQYAR